jgi:peroxiredoxin Q/BCP
LELDLLSDPDGTTMRQYGALVDTQFADTSYERTIRSTYLVDPKGYVRYHWPEVIPQGHAERVKNKLAALQS